MLWDIETNEVNEWNLSGVNLSAQTAKPNVASIRGIQIRMCNYHIARP